MRFSTAALVLASAGYAVAATTTTSAATSSSSSSCDAQNIVDTCVSSIRATQVDACSQTDWACLCGAYTQLLTCYNNCPSDPNKASVQTQITQFCNAASQVASATATKTSSSTQAGRSATKSVSGSSQATLATSATGGSSGSSATGSRASASASASASKGASGHVAVPAGGLLAVVLGVFGML